MLEEPSDAAHTAPSLGRSAAAPAATSALAQSGASISGEIRNDWTPSGDASPSKTLLGVSPFHAVRGNRDTVVDGAPVIDPGRLYVTPATVAAIAKARHLPTEPTIQVDLGAKPLNDIEKERASSFRRAKAERADAFAKLRADHADAKARLKSEPLARIAKHTPNAPFQAPTAPTRWDTFEDLGLAPKPITKKAQKLVVSTYRLLGFGILSLIVVVLVGYIGTTAFYFLNHTWVTPVALSANDEKVVALQGQLAAQLNERAKLVGDLAESERAIRAEQTFQMQFARAIKKDLEGRRAALGRVKQLATTAAVTRNQIRTTNDDYSASAAARMEDDYKAKMIDRNAMLAGKFQLAQISSANLSLAERQAEFNQRAAELAAETQSLDAILSDKTASAALSYDVLKIARDYQTSKLALAREMGNRDRLTASLARQDKIIEGLQQSAYLRAVSDNASVALVPYKNLDNVEKGTKLYGCRLNMLFCHEVGKVLDILPGEVEVKHPSRDSVLRGRMIEMQMTDADAAQDEVLFAGGKPLGV
jgi:hypothetical protein